MGEGHWSDSQFSFVPFQIGPPPRFWNGGSFDTQAQYTHKNGLNFGQGVFGDGRPIVLPARVGAFYMTRCKGRRVRGKGLARHFLQIVPTCL